MSRSYLLLKICLIASILVPLSNCVHAADQSGKNRKSINIGLLIQDKSSLSALHGAELALQKANRINGPDGITYNLIELSMEGPWGNGSKQAVNLVFDQDVVAILGSCDGRSAHLAEQVAAKTRVIFLSAATGDPTLAQAFVPWFFNCVPNYLQQADALIEAVYDRNKLNRVGVIADSSYDSKLALSSFLKRLKQAGKAEPEQVFFESSVNDPNYLKRIISKDVTEGIILFSQPATSLKIIQELERIKTGKPVFGSLNLLDENDINKIIVNSSGKFILISSGQWFNARGLEFMREYRKKFGKNPDADAAYAYDGMSLIINAIKASGTERESIQKYLKNVAYDGVTGSFRFDDKGNRIGNLTLMEIKNGYPVKLPK